MDVRIQHSSGVTFVELKMGWKRRFELPEHGLAYADFNMAGGGDLLPVLRADYTGLVPVVGQWVQLRDDTGNSVKARIARVEDDVLWTDPFWPSWITAAYDGPRDYLFEPMEPPHLAPKWDQALGTGGEQLVPA